MCHQAAGQGLLFFRQGLRQSREVSRAELGAGGADHRQQGVGDLGRWACRAVGSVAQSWMLHNASMNGLGKSPKFPGFKEFQRSP